ncbi:K02A2.6-like [Cordylochernes scorpioides]|uniref:RNA-directed DNA polymerase n=1 Tax=Cordylochernes scorpioides TaxID=51811 RepID=A0ABY6KKU3_9ARAC|nr:K02A2.6-like [Cordylochernes scorpioides]
MYLMGDRADDIFRTFKFEKEEEATKIDSVLKAFDSHFCVRKNIIYERAKFNSRIQEDREPVDEFITSLYKLADSCEFEGLHEQLIRDRIVVGVRDKALSERMQLDNELTLEKAVKLVRQQEAVRQQQIDLQRPSTSQKVNQVKFNSKKQSPKQQQQPSRKKEKEGQACRAEGQKCNLCSKTGHFANCCPDKQAKTAEVKAVSELDEEIGFLLEVSAVEDSSNLDDDEGECRRRWTAEIQVNGKKVKFKLDSQADVTCVPLCLFKKIMGQQRLVKSDINLRAAEFSELQTVGMFISTLRNGNYEIKEKIYVIRRLSEPLLSRRACELLNLARRIEVVATRINPIKEFPEVFEGLGQIGNPYEIKLKPGAKPYAVHTPRRVPIPLMEKLKTRLDIPGKELLDADALSRQPLLTTEGGENERQTSAHINAVLSSITDKDEMLTKIFEAQQEDTTLKAVVNYLEQGWPDKKKMSPALLSYWHVKDELGVQNGLLMRSCRLVIPASMKLEILDKLHAGHFGIIKTRLRARETVWWPGISEEIAETDRKCSVCIQEAVSKHEPLIPTNFPTRPWQKIGMDLFKFENKWYLVAIDYYSRFPEIIQLDRLTASVVVRSCKSIFARQGIPETVVSDNGTQFGAAREFANFARQYGFTHVTSSPRFPQSNGMAEAGVKIAKLILKKNQDPSLGLLEYRSTPLENGYSPAELLMGRKLRTTLPIAPENLNPRLVDSQTLKRKEGRRRKDMKSRYDRRCGATDMEELSEVLLSSDKEIIEILAEDDEADLEKEMDDCAHYQEIIIEAIVAYEDAQKQVAREVTRLDQLMDFLEREILIQQNIQLAKGGFQSAETSDKERRKGFYKKKNNIPTVTGLQQMELGGCIFCEKKHASQNCFAAKKMSLEEKRKVIREKKLKADDENFVCKVTVRDQSKICQALPRIPKTSLISRELEQRKIKVTDLGNDNPPIELLIGADIYGKLMTGKTLQLDCGLTAMLTHFGWTLLGSLKEWSDEENSMLVMSMKNEIEGVEKKYSETAVDSYVGVKEAESKDYKAKDSEPKGDGVKDSEAKPRGDGVKDSETAIKGYESVNNSEEKTKTNKVEDSEVADQLCFPGVPRFRGPHPPTNVTNHWELRFCPLLSGYFMIFCVVQLISSEELIAPCHDFAVPEDKRSKKTVQIGSEKEQRWRNKPAIPTKRQSNLSSQQETIFTEETPPQRTSAYPLTDHQRREQADRANDSPDIPASHGNRAAMWPKPCDKFHTFDLTSSRQCSRQQATINFTEATSVYKLYMERLQRQQEYKPRPSFLTELSHNLTAFQGEGEKFDHTSLRSPMDPWNI